MKKEPKPKVKLMWTGDEPIRARLVKSGDKVEFQKDSVQMADFDVAEALSRHYKKFKIVHDGEVAEDVAAEAPKKKRKAKESDEK